MKITKIDVLRANPDEQGWTPVFCRVYTDTGIYGDGEVALAYGGASKAAFGMLKDMAPLLIGMDPLDNEVIWMKLYRGCFWGLNGGPVVFGAISAFDLAMWDIKGKAFNVPLYKLLGGKCRDSLRAYASQLQEGWGVGRSPAKTPEDYANNSKIAVEKGFDAVKINFLTHRPDAGRYSRNEQTAYIEPDYLEIAESRIAAVREAVGPKVELILENHCYTDVQSAIQYGNMAKKYGVYYFEEPTTPHPELLAQVHQETGLPVASGERIYTRWQYERCFNAHAIQVVQPDLGTCGGLTEVKKICDMAFMHEIGIQIHVCGSPLVTAASLHLEATLPNFVIHEYNVNCMMPTMLKMATHDYQPTNGKMPVPELPGIGSEISEFAYAHSEIETFEATGKNLM